MTDIECNSAHAIDVSNSYWLPHFRFLEIEDAIIDKNGTLRITFRSHGKTEPAKAIFRGYDDKNPRIVKGNMENLRGERMLKIKEWSNPSGYSWVDVFTYQNMVHDEEPDFRIVYQGCIRSTYLPALHDNNEPGRVLGAAFVFAIFIFLIFGIPNMLS